MAAGDSAVSICNIALLALGEAPIVSVSPPDNTKRAIACATLYDPTRRSVLRAFQWNCATRRAQLAASADVPAFGYANAFPLPADYLRVIELPQDGYLYSDEPPRWAVEDGAILSDASAPLNLIYVYDLQDPSQFDAGLVQTLAYALAVELAEVLTQDATKYQRAVQILADKAETARLINSQENSAETLEEDILVRSRG